MYLCKQLLNKTGNQKQGDYRAITSMWKLNNEPLNDQCIIVKFKRKLAASFNNEKYNTQCQSLWDIAKSILREMLKWLPYKSQKIYKLMMNFEDKQQTQSQISFITDCLPFYYLPIACTFILIASHSFWWKSLK